MKIVIFGLGKKYKENIDRIKPNDTVVAYIDNNNSKWGEKIGDVVIMAPNMINEINYDLVVIMSDYAVDMKKQLFELNVSEKKIMHYREYCKVKKITPKLLENYKKRLLIVSYNIGYHGGTIAALNLAKVFCNLNFYIDICAEEIDEKVRNEYENEYIHFYEVNCCYTDSYTKDFCLAYDVLIFNTYLVLRYAIEASKYKNVNLWLHESEFIYENDYWKNDSSIKNKLKNVKIFAVSDFAKNNFLKYVCEKDICIMPYALEDRFNEYPQLEEKKITFAVVGGLMSNKRQIEFVKSILMLDIEHRSKCQFYLIGKKNDEDYYKQLTDLCKNLQEVKIIGELSSEELTVFYEKVIDILIIPSLNETMSIVATEGLMHKKIVVLSENAGMAKYIQHGKNGFIFNPTCLMDLKIIMEKCIDDFYNLDNVRESARQTYENNFTIENMENRVKVLLEDCEL